VSLDVASLIDVYGCGVHAVNRAPIRAYTTAVVLGTGPIGMCTGQVVKASGAKRVIMVGTRDEPLALAKEIGAADEVVVNSRVDPVQAVLELTDGEGADVVIESVGGRAPTLGQAVGMAAPGGMICILGIFSEGGQELDTRLGYRKELTITWANSYSYWNGRSEYDIALDLVASGRVKAEPLITHHFPLEKIAEAFVAADDKRGSGAVKVLVHA
jgi:threonine dehydrogenase-like Zn-dependent dehydrogenase